jgi:cephalosporin hydroxylase
MTLRRTLRALPVSVYNSVHKRICSVSQSASSSPELKEIEDRVAHFPSDISDHLATIFSEAVAAKPRLIVELGVRGGESRFALERAARVTRSYLVSVDIEDCETMCGQSPLWHFVKSDDIQFARIFRDWCSERGIEPKIDVLFIDTSHLYEHTVREIKAWFPYLSASCKVLFHDTYPKRFYRRLDGTIGEGVNSKRGVIQPIEEYLGTRLDERIDFVTIVHDWLIRHWAHCNGLTTMERNRSSRTSVEDSAGEKAGDSTASVTVP